MKITSRTSATVVITMAVFGWLASLYAQNNQDSTRTQVPPEIRFVAAGIENARQQLQCGQSAVTVYQFTPKEYFKTRQPLGGQPSHQDREETTKSWWNYQAPKMSLSTRIDPASSDIMRYQRLVIDVAGDKSLQGYDDSAKNSRGGTYYMGSIMPHGQILKNGLAQEYEMNDPRYYAYYYGNLPLDKLFLKKTGIPMFDGMPSPVYKGEASVEGSRCMMVEVRPSKDIRWIYWIDVEHGFLVRRQESYRQRGDRELMYMEVRVPRLVESNGSYLPALVEKKQFFVNAKGQNDNAVVNNRPLLTRVSISDFKADCNISPEVFLMKWPVGTNITDVINQQKLVVIAVGKVDLADLNKQRKRQGKPEYVSTPIDEKELLSLNKRLKTQGKAELKDVVAVAVGQEDIATLENLQKQQDAPNARVLEPLRQENTP